MARPECFEFAMDFLGEPEEHIIREYIATLENALTEIAGYDDGAGCCPYGCDTPTIAKRALSVNT
jgi:hypothetical protein